MKVRFCEVLRHSFQDYTPLLSSPARRELPQKLYSPMEEGVHPHPVILFVHTINDIF